MLCVRLRSGLRSAHVVQEVPTIAQREREQTESEQRRQKWLIDKQQSQESNDVLAYWLSNTSTLMFLLQRTLKSSGAAGGAPKGRRPNVTLFGRMTQGFRSSPSGGGGVPYGNGGIGGLDILRQVEAKYPALLFKQQLTPYVEKMYGMIRDNLKKEITPVLGLCIQAPRTSRASLSKTASRSPSTAATAQQPLEQYYLQPQCFVEHNEG